MAEDVISSCISFFILFFIFFALPEINAVLFCWINRYCRPDRFAPRIEFGSWSRACISLLMQNDVMTIIFVWGKGILCMRYVRATIFLISTSFPHLHFIFISSLPSK